MSFNVCILFIKHFGLTCKYAIEDAMKWWRVMHLYFLAKGYRFPSRPMQWIVLYFNRYFWWIVWWECCIAAPQYLVKFWLISSQKGYTIDLFNFPPQINSSAFIRVLLLFTKCKYTRFGQICCDAHAHAHIVQIKNISYCIQQHNNIRCWIFN